MRITFLLPTANMSGGVRVVAIYAEKLQARGHDVLLVSQKRRPIPLKRKIKSLLTGHGWPSAPKSDSHLDNISVPHKVLNHYGPAVESDVPDADVVIATWWATAYNAVSFAPSKGVKVYFLQHYETCMAFPEQKEKVRATWRMPYHKIVICQWLKDLAAERYDDHDVSLVPNSVELKQFNAPPRNKQCKPIVGVMYSGARFKGCDISLNAFKLAKKQCPELQLVAFGHPENKKRLPLPPGTRFVERPDQDKIKEVYAACDAWLFGSRSEGFGLPILEAMACRTPVIGTPAGAAPELIGKHGGGMLVEHEDPEAMAQAILRVCEMPNAEWKAMSDAAYQTATEYTWDDATDLFEAALYQAVEKAKDMKTG